MIVWVFFVFFGWLLVPVYKGPPQPAYQIAYQQQLMNPTAPSLEWPTNNPKPSPPPVVVFPPCQVYPGVTVCP